MKPLAISCNLCQPFPLNQVDTNKRNTNLSDKMKAPVQILMANGFTAVSRFLNVTRASTTRLVALGIGILVSLAWVAAAQTLVPPGPTSGEWTLTGSPYIVVDNFSVPSGTNLIIDPGVTVLIGSNLTITANGFIHGAGTPSQRITISAASSTYNYNTIWINNSPGTNRFHYCDFVNAQTAVSMSDSGGSQPMVAEILNCTFSNCASQAILGLSQPICSGNTTFNPVIQNCIFSGGSNGCVVQIFRVGCGDHYEYGYGNPNICGNIFQNLTGTAFLLTVSGGGGGGQPTFVNNTIVGCRGGVNAMDPWDARVQDNIFAGSTSAAMVSGSLSRAVSYNAFYGNATNFTGYPGPFGQCIFSNRNGTACDLLYNICQQNPMFIATNDFHLGTNSPCANAGVPDTAFANLCSPPSTSTNFPDLGAYGGPYACNWLETVPKLPTQLSLTKSNGFLWLNWGAIPRSSYQVQYLASNLDATSGTNRWLTNATVSPADTTASIAVSPYPATNSKAFYRVRSLGRATGN